MPCKAKFQADCTQQDTAVAHGTHHVAWQAKASPLLRAGQQLCSFMCKPHQPARAVADLKHKHSAEKEFLYCPAAAAGRIIGT